MFCSMLAVVYKLLFTFLRLGITVYEIPSCSVPFFDIIGVMFLVIQASIAIAQNPNTGKAKKAQSKVNTASTTPDSSTSSTE